MSDVCTQCGLCCRLFYINLSEEEYRSGKYKTQFEKYGLIHEFPKAVSCGANILKQKKNGSCIYLRQNRCTIHESRPQACRAFFHTSKLKKFRSMVEQIQKRRG